MATRRGFLAGLAAIGLPHRGWAAAGSPAFLAAGKTGDGFVLHGLSETGDSLFHLPLPDRGHAAAAHPQRALAVAFARRPGTFALVLDCISGAVSHHLAPPKGQQFNGHGVFSRDGSVLMTSEVVGETSEGRVGLWDAADFSRIGDWPSHGIGPHDMKLLPDGRLIVANGGIATDPGDRTKLNLDTMRPNLALIDRDGRPEELHALPAALQQNSIRHLALSGDTVALALQWEGDPADPVPLLALWKPGQGLVMAEADPEDWLAMQGYAGSVAMTRDGARVAVTSPKGGAVMLFDGAGRHLATHRRADLCGAAAMGDTGLVLTDGQGAVWACDETGLTLLNRADVAWDNHLVAL